MALNPREHPELYDVLILDGDRVSPGVVTLSGHDRTKNWDIKEPSGSAGASSVLRGDPLGQFEATFTLAYDPYDGVDDFQQWELFSRWLYSLVNGPKPISVSVYHPDLALQGYTDVTVRSVGGLVRQSNGIGIAKVVFGEHRPPKPKPAAKPSANASKQNDTSSPDPNAEVKRQLREATEQAKAL